MTQTKGLNAYKNFWDEQFRLKRHPWDEEKIVKLTLSNNYAHKLKELEFSTHSLAKKDGKLTLRLKVPYNYHELDDFKSKTIELLGIDINWLVDFTVCESHCTHQR